MKFIKHVGKHYLFLKKNKIKPHLRKSLHYNFKFASIISPGSLKNMTLAGRPSNPRSNNNLYIKQSYVLLTWMTYIREVQLTQTKKKKNDDSDDSAPTPAFFVYPKKTSKLTFLKAPMAHKTFSQEQFLNKSYQMSISFNTNFRNNSLINSVNNSIFVSLYLRNNYLPVETNLLFLKRLRMSITCKDSTFMKLI